MAAGTAQIIFSVLFRKIRIRLRAYGSGSVFFFPDFHTGIQRMKLELSLENPFCYTIANDFSRFTLCQTRGCAGSHFLRVCVHYLR